MPQRKLLFDKNGTTFLLLNIMGHDPIHDFGQPSDTRWSQVKQQIDLIKPFLLSSEDFESISSDEPNQINSSDEPNQTISNDEPNQTISNDDFNRTLKRNRERNREQNNTNSAIRKSKRVKDTRGGASLDTNLNNFILNRRIVVPNIKAVQNRFNDKLLLNKNNLVTNENINGMVKMSVDDDDDIIDDFSDNSKAFINDYIEKVKRNIVMNLFVYHLNNRSLHDDVMYSPLDQICDRIIISDTKVEDIRFLMTLSRHFYEYIVNIFIKQVDENKEGIIVFDACMDFSILKVRYIYERNISQYNGISNTMIINKSSEVKKFIDIDTQSILESFLNSNHFIIKSIINKKNKGLSGGLNSGAKDADIVYIRKLLEFVEGVFQDTSTDEKIQVPIRTIRNMVYRSIMLSKGYDTKDDNTHFSLEDIEKSMRTKSQTSSGDNREQLSKYKEIIVNSYVEMFKKLGMEINKINNIEKGLQSKEYPLIPIRSNERRHLNVPELINTFLSKLLKEEFSIRKSHNEKIRKENIEEDKRIIALSSGNLTPDNKMTAYKFISFIAKSSLYVIGCCDSSGVVIIKQQENTATSSILNSEIDCIRTIAGRHGVKNGTYWSSTNEKQDIDDRLFSYMKDPKNQYIIGDNLFNETDLLLPVKTKYVINNAANISSSFLNKTFCPYTSILDGMSQCSWASASLEKRKIEYGDMDFIITGQEPTSPSYNGKLKINRGNSVDITLDIKLDKMRIVKTEEIEMNSNTLVAHVVLRKTLNAIVQYIDNAERKYLYAEPDIFQTLFNIGVTEISKKGTTSAGSSHPNSIFTILFQHLLFKGVGDIFQEINVIAKYGGYTENNYYCGEDIQPFHGNRNDNGNAMRCFVAKDRVSVCRYLFIKRQGREQDINTQTYGGYLDGNDNKSNTGSRYKEIELKKGGTNILHKVHSTLRKGKNSCVVNSGNIIINLNIRKTQKIKRNENMTINITI